MVTARGDDERRSRVSEPGAFKFITKPVDFNLLNYGNCRAPPTEKTCTLPNDSFPRSPGTDLQSASGQQRPMSAVGGVTASEAWNEPAPAGGGCVNRWRLVGEVASGRA